MSINFQKLLEYLCVYNARLMTSTSLDNFLSWSQFSIIRFLHFLLDTNLPTNQLHWVLLLKSDKNCKRNGTFNNCSSITKKKSNEIILFEIFKWKLTVFAIQCGRYKFEIENCRYDPLDAFWWELDYQHVHTRWNTTT